MEKWLINRRKGVFYITEPKLLFEEMYVQVRKQENRLLEDEIVVQLPCISSDHPYHEEWKKRQDTCTQFMHHLKQHPPKTALDIGCGNGWFTHQISTIATSTFGLDVGTEELEQAARCFANESTKFICCTDWSLLPNNTFDLITFNASLQYFELNEAFWKQVYRCLTSTGVIHILDTPFYKQQEIASAKQRSNSYFSKMNAAAASNYYHHSCWNDLPQQAKVVYRFNKWKKIFRKNSSPFPWIVIHKPA